MPKMPHEVKADAIADLQCRVPVLDYFHVNEGEATLKDTEGVTAFEWCIEAGTTIDLSFHLATTGSDDANIVIDLLINDEIVATTIQGGQSKSVSLFFRGTVAEDSEMAINMVSSGADSVISPEACQFGFKIYPECYEVTGDLPIGCLDK